MNAIQRRALMPSEYSACATGFASAEQSNHSGTGIASGTRRRPATGICRAAFVLLFALAGAAQAQQTSPAKPKPPTMTKQQIIDSPEWREATSSYARWLRYQKLYSEEQIAAFQKQWRADVERMSAEELVLMLAEMRAKLAVLLSPEAQEANTWIGQYMAVAAQKKVDALRAKAPDLVDVTPEALEQSLQGFQANRGARRQAQSQFDRQRQQQVDQQVAANRAAAQRQTQLAQQRASRPSQPSVQSSYTPKKPLKQPSSGPTIAIGPFGGVTTYYGGHRW